MPGLLSRQNAPQVSLVDSSHVRHVVRHVNVAVRRTLIASHARRPEALLRRGSVEPWNVDADAQPTILAWMGGYARQAAIAVHGSCFLKLLSGLGDELLSGGHPLPCVLLRKTCRIAHLQVMPKRLPREVGKA